MDDKDKAQQPHEDLGEVGELGHVGELGSNAAGADRTPLTADAAAPLKFHLVPAGQAAAWEVSAEEQLSIALVRVGFEAEESKKMAKSAVEEIARRKE